MRAKLRNNLTGFFLGKYDVKEIAKETMIEREVYKTSFENIFYNEALIILSPVISIALIGLAIFYSPWIIFALLIVPPMIFFALELELVFLSDERVFIERKGILEKLLNTRNVRTVSLEQIAIIAYKRAPVNRPLLLFGLIGISGLIALTFFVELYLIIIASITALIFLYIIWFSLRLTKRSIELSVIGSLRDVGLGRTKGAPVSFLADLQELVFERIHHYERHRADSKALLNIEEFPLRHQGKVKEMVKMAENELQKRIIAKIALENQDINKLVKTLKIYSKVAVEEELLYLEKQSLIEKDELSSNWKIKGL